MVMAFGKAYFVAAGQSVTRCDHRAQLIDQRALEPEARAVGRVEGQADFGAALLDVVGHHLRARDDEMLVNAGIF